MNKKTLWLEVRPDSKETLATMKFIVESCRAAHEWAADKEGSTEVLFQQFSEVGLNKTLLTIVPKEAVLQALNEGADKKKFTSHFYLNPRRNWRETKHYQKRMTWDEYLAGKTAQVSTKIVPDQVVRDLYEEGVMRFHWGTIKFVRWYLLKIGRFIAKLEITPENFLRRVVKVEFRYSEKSQKWQIGLTVDAQDLLHT